MSGPAVPACRTPVSRLCWAVTAPQEAPGMTELSDFRIELSQQRLAAILDAVARFDWSVIPDLAEGGDAWSAGASTAFIRRLCRHWTSGFDWRAQEAAINRFPQRMADIGGQRVHLL